MFVDDRVEIGFRVYFAGAKNHLRLLLRRWATWGLHENTGIVRLPHVHGRARRAGGKARPVPRHHAPAAKHRSVGYSQHIASSQSEGMTTAPLSSRGRP